MNPFDFVDRFGKYVDGTNPQTAATVGTALLIIYAIFALANCFFGYRLKRVWITLVGFLIGFFLGLIPSLILIDSEAVVIIALAIAIVAGVLIALVAYRFYKVGIFVWVAFMTFPVVSSMFAGKLQFLGVILGIAAGIIVGILSLKYLRAVCIISTSVNGGILAAQNILALFNIFQIGIILAVGAVLAVLGMLLQFHLTKPDDDET